MTTAIITIREQILAVMKERVENILDLQGKVFRSRTEALSRGETPALVIRPANESVSEVGDLAERDFYVQFLLIARGDSPDQIIDPLIAQVHQALATDPSFGGLAAQLFEVSSAWTYESADQSACQLDVRYRVRWYSLGNSLTAPP